MSTPAVKRPMSVRVRARAPPAHRRNTRDRDRHVHHVLSAFLGRDDDLFHYLRMQRLRRCDGNGEGGAANVHGVLRRFRCRFSADRAVLGRPSAA